MIEKSKKSRFGKHLFIVTLIFIGCNLNSFAETRADSLITIAGKEYKAKGIYKFFFGTHWRNFWTTSINVEVLSLKNFSGGLTPIEKGGGFATTSLKLKDKEGTVWKFRSVNKNPTKVLPEELRNTIVGNIIKDQTSSSNPYAALVVPTFLNAVGVLNAPAKLFIMPDDKTLGIFREEFVGMLGTIELHPDEDQKSKKLFLNSEKILGTFKLFYRLEKKKKEKVASKEFLKARLMDIYLGDWDRHTDQWRWALIKKEGKKLWYPIPRDRDQVFAKFDGLFPRLAIYRIPQLVHFDKNFHQIEDASWSGRFLDRRFLTEITEQEWDSVAVFIQNRITDNVIEKAVKKLPKECPEEEREELISVLKSRRNKITEVAKEYYELINTYADIYLSAEDDYVEVNRISNEKTKVEWLKRKTSKKYYSKIFNNGITKQIRIHLLEGNDKIVVKGKVDDSPLLKIEGGSGKDIIEDYSEVSGYFLSILPFRDAETKTEIYDSDENTVIKYGSGTTYYSSPVPLPKTDAEKYEPQQKDRSVDWITFPEVDINSTYGLVIGGGIKLYKYDFRMVPYKYQLSASVAYTSRPNSLIAKGKGRFNSIIKGFTVGFAIKQSTKRFIDYYGYGNNSSYDRDLDENNFYRTEHEKFSANIFIEKEINNTTKAELGLLYESSIIWLKNPLFAKDFPITNYGTERNRSLGSFITLTYDSRDKTNLTKYGNFFKLSGTYYPKLIDIEENFSNFKLDLRTYLSQEKITLSTLLLRIKGSINIGNFPFNKSVFFGGGDALRGFSLGRFAGKSSIALQSEVRLHISDVKIIIPAKLGVFSFAETGRVFVKNDNSKLWHSSFGIGTYLSFLKRALVVTATLGFSNERMTFYFTLGTEL